MSRGYLIFLFKLYFLDDEALKDSFFSLSSPFKNFFLLQAIIMLSFNGHIYHSYNAHGYYMLKCCWIMLIMRDIKANEFYVRFFIEFHYSQLSDLMSNILKCNWCKILHAIREAKQYTHFTMKSFLINFLCIRYNLQIFYHHVNVFCELCELVIRKGQLSPRPI